MSKHYRLNFVVQHRFHLNSEGEIVSLGGYDYDFFARRLLPSFDRVRLLARFSGGSPGQLAGLLGPEVELISLGDWSGLSGFFTRLPSLLWTLNQQDWSHPTLLVAPSPLAFLCFYLLRFRGRRFAAQVISDPGDFLASGAYRHPLRSPLRLFSKVTLKRLVASSCQTGYVAEAFRARYPSYRACLLPNVTLRESDFVARPRSWEGRPFKLVSVGLAADFKGQSVLVKALSMVDFDFHLTVAGSGRASTLVGADIAALGLEKRVTMVGRLSREKLFELFDQADLFVAPSLAEGLPRAPLEAMARGLPCLGTRVGDMEELLPSWALTQPNDPGALAALLTELHAHPARLHRLSELGLQTAHRYRSTQVDQKWLAFCQAMLQQGQE
jgi:glycosyltransferase involved in cell wall biosynthesis